jgi:4'-phosphopantetheinyl transferase
MVELWLVDLQAAAPALAALEREAPRLTTHDRARARRLATPAERRLRLAAYSALRILLERAGGPRVRGRRIVRTAGDRPRLAAAGLHFSLSHTGTFALIGVRRGGAVGVDLEASRKIVMSLRRRQEILAVASGLADPLLAEPACDMSVLEAWCRLEACAKVRGTGVGRLLGELGLRDAGSRELPLACIRRAAHDLVRNARLAVADVKMPGGLFAAVAVARGRARVRVRHLPTTRAGIARLLRPEPQAAPLPQGLQDAQHPACVPQARSRRARRRGEAGRRSSWRLGD